MCSKYHMEKTGVMIFFHVYSEEGMKHLEHSIPIEEWVLMLKVCPFVSRGKTSFKDLSPRE